MALLVGIALTAGCRPASEPAAPGDRPPFSESTGAVTAPSPSTPTKTRATPPRVLMPDLVGLPSAIASRRLGEIEMVFRIDLSSSWRGVRVVDCAVRPHTVVRQAPAPGTPLKRHTMVQIREAYVDIERFRGPCEPSDGDLGPVHGPDAALARQFYRFAADPTLGAPFVAGEVWAGIEGGPTGVTLGPDELGDLAAWQIDTLYAERSGPFSALDVVASSGGYFQLYRGVRGTCGFGEADRPPRLAGLRAITLTSPRDTVTSCMQWWAVTLFLDSSHRIAGVALRLGAP